MSCDLYFDIRATFLSLILIPSAKAICTVYTLSNQITCPLAVTKSHAFEQISPMKKHWFIVKY